ncbi:MAG: Gfo/Idh/MocA family oxidoreductase [Phycisphaerae bacterium]|nr:Gfo/Idh/MocA family oxidoreductase [Phycisphaerae bacterium]NIP53240.1 Gfo/Idh/MocA family oxidoreductase [Phycisphaerae bacterium]NIS52266.1 Gfo/Idh/MocA family oxidoreductase [Phycisphaerae bacterium]NIU09812.1 Gfo/Idh/MocA family oxidoreductase [Phycisphaerae bacterium]NIU59450.1 Gfo/Idh/MocA family oxidoreductase [Phycisphaerae bacterium]
MKSKNNISRRSFLNSSAKAAATTLTGLSLWGTGSSWAGANDRVRVAVVGIKGHGFGSHIRGYPSLPNVEVAAICDVDENLFPERLKWFEQNKKPIPKTYVDIRKLLEDKNIDAISVATPNHWHALAGIWACQAGKHAHIEKPFTHNVFEGQKLIEAAKRYKCIVHHGTESRSSEAYQQAVEFMRKGGLGEVYMAKGMCYKWRNTIKHTPEEPVPPGVHYNLWLGPAPKRPFSRNRFHYNWHWHWDYGNGDIGNQGVHEMDIARWGLGVTLPTKVMSMGGHFMFDDDQETANAQIAVFEFPNPKGGGDKKKILQFEVRHWMTNYEGGFASPPNHNIGNIFYGSEGYMVMYSEQWKTFMGKNREPGPSGKETKNVDLMHYQNFIDAIRAGDPSILRGNVQEGHYSCTLVHLANTSYRLGRSLNFDPKKQKYVDDAEANKMLTRNYRKPFVVPKNV